MITTQYEHNGNIICVHEEEKTEKEKLAQQRYIEIAAANFLRKVLTDEARRAKASEL